MFRCGAGSTLFSTARRLACSCICAGESGTPRVLQIIDQIWTLRIQNGDHGRYLTDLPQHGHRDPHAIDGRLEYQDGLIGCQPSRMILEELSRDSEPRSPHPDPTEKGSEGSGRKDRGRN